MSLFKSSPAVATATAQKPTAKAEKPSFLSFLRKPDETQRYAIASFPVGAEHVIRLMPVTAEGAPQSMEVDVLTVRHNETEGKILAGDWFVKTVQPWLLKNCRERFQRFVDGKPTGDVKLRTQKRVLFFAIRTAAATPEKPAHKQLCLCNLPGTNYPGAKVGDGEDFLSGGAYWEDFDQAIGRRLKIVASGSDAKTRTLKITPERNATPLTDDDIAALPVAPDGTPYIPVLKDTLRESSREEIVQCLRETLPADVFEKMMREVQL